MGARAGGSESREGVIARVRHVLGSTPRGDLSRYPIELRLEEHDLVMVGEVPEVADKKIALQRATAVPGADAVIDDLRVRAKVRRSDEAIAEEVTAALAGDPALSDCEGSVGSRHETEVAEADVWSLFGVDAAENHL